MEVTIVIDPSSAHSLEACKRLIHIGCLTDDNTQKIINEKSLRKNHLKIARDYPNLKYFDSISRS